MVDTTKDIAEKALNEEEKAEDKPAAGDQPQKLSKGQKKKLKEKAAKEAARLAAEQNPQGAKEAGAKQATPKPGERIPLRVLGEWPADSHPG